MSDVDNYWTQACDDLGICVVYNCLIPGFEHVGTVDAIIECFGGPRGMVVTSSYDTVSNIVTCLTAAGYGFSIMDKGGVYNRHVTIEILRDWGWACDASPPEWY